MNQNKICFTIMSNTEGALNKLFSINTDGALAKESYAFLKNGVADVIEVSNLTEFNQMRERLLFNQALCLGIAKGNNITKFRICLKGKEELPYLISRSKPYWTYPTKGLLLFDYDKSSDMPSNMLVNSTSELYTIFLQLFPFLNTAEILFNYSSSSGITSKEGIQLTQCNGIHGFSIFTGITDESIDNFVEYIKRASVYLNLFYVKIHVNGNTSFQTIFDLSVLKSASSRLCFEASPTLNDGLIQIKPETFGWNLNTGNSFDLSSISYDHLNDWRPAYEEAKFKIKDKIELVKEEYLKTKSEVLISNGCEPSIAVELVKAELRTGKISVKSLIEVGQEIC